MDIVGVGTGPRPASQRQAQIDVRGDGAAPHEAYPSVSEVPFNINNYLYNVLAARPAEWMPWNYRETLARVAV
jgi:hypothetical protein